MREVDARLPDVRAVVVLRDPVDRAWSFYNFEKARGGLPESLSFEEYVRRCEEKLRDDGLVEEHTYRALRGGQYAFHLQQWFDVLGERFKGRLF